MFVTLKLCGVLHWSWLWVLCPFWGGFAIWLVIVTVAVALSAWVQS
ncbi:MAG TPA: hypothetical protein VGK73_31435 [Polyangiaceae bacterium]